MESEIPLLIKYLAEEINNYNNNNINKETPSKKNSNSKNNSEKKKNFNKKNNNKILEEIFLSLFEINM